MRIKHWAMRGLIAVSVIFAGVGLAGCAGMKNSLSGEVIGASVTLGGFTVGLSGKFPQAHD